MASPPKAAQGSKPAADITSASADTTTHPPPTTDQATAEAPGQIARPNTTEAVTAQGQDFAGAPRQRIKIQVDSDEVKVEVLRQVEYYFSDENLVNDPHLLALIEKDPEASVNLGRILGWPRMLKYLPTKAIIEELKKSKVLELIDNNKRIKRKIPFDMDTAKVAPSLSEQDKLAQRMGALLAETPGLTRGMLKPTGFEHSHKEPALTAGDAEENLDQYSPERPHWERIETAIINFRMKRKFHQEAANLFDAFCSFGGIETRAAAFTGGQDIADKEELTKKEIAFIKQKYFVRDEVTDSIDEADGKWVIDFEGTTKGFFSTRFPRKVVWCGESQDQGQNVKASCNVLRNWFNYLLHHNVFPEYTGQIIKARDVVNLAEKEFPVMAKAQALLPGAFGTACSCVLDGVKAAIRVTKREGWMTDKDWGQCQVGYNDQDAQYIIMAGLGAWHPEVAREAKAAMVRARSGKEMADNQEELGLRVIRVVRSDECSEEGKKIFEKCKGTVIPPMGKLICKRFIFPQNASKTAPPSTSSTTNNFEFLMDDETLSHCFPGMKLDVIVKKLDFGIMWIDHIYNIYGSFFQWCWNEEVDAVKKASKPAFYERKKGQEDQDEGVAEQDAGDEDSWSDGDFD